MPKGYQYKPIDSTPWINLAAQMDNRSNFQILNVDPNTKGITFVNLENADLFNSKSLSTRLGVVDIANGIINSNEEPTSIINLETNLPSGTTQSYVSQIGAPAFYDYIGLVIIPSGATNIYSGNITFRGVESTYGDYLTAPVKLTMRLVALDQVSVPASGLGFMSGTSAAPKNILHNIALSGNYNVPPYPQYNPNQGTTLTTTLPNPKAVSDPQIVDLGAYTLSGSYYSDPKTVAWKFTAPFQMVSGSVYFLQNYIELTSGTTNRNYEIQSISHSSVDISPNTSIGEEFFYFGAPVNQANAVRNAGGAPKSWLKTNIYRYNTPSYILVDNPTAAYDFAAPLASGSFIGAPDYPDVVLSPSPFSSFNGNNETPRVSTTTTEFGQVITIPSGTWTIYGSYFFGNTYSGVSNTVVSAPINTYTRSKATVDPSNYNVGYYSYLSQITASSGTAASGTYVINNRTRLASYSGNNVFTSPIDLPTSQVFDYNYNLEKLYSLYDNPITITVNSGTQYLLSFGFYDYNTKGPLTDYSVFSISPYQFFLSPLKIGMENNLYSGTFVYNKNLDGHSFQQMNFSALNGGSIDLSCGLVYVASGNAITDIYDYRVGENRSQRVITGIRNELRSWQLRDPGNQTVIYSGAAIGNNFKWSNSTYQNLFIGHQYSQSSGVVWDQLYSGTANHFTQYHGQRPTFSLNQVSGVNGGIIGASGLSVSVILATQMASGGLRASEPQTITITQPSGAYIQLSGTDIFAPSAYPSGSQYAFDVLPQATYVFATQASGSVYYLAGLVSAPNSGAAAWLNPLPNSGTFVGVSGVFINDVSNLTLTQQVPQVINYDQQYLTNQVNTPKFKKTIVYKDYVLGAGDVDNPSRLWYSEQFTANIFGTDGVFTGFIDIDLNNGSPITGMEIYKDYLIVFKYNSCYRLTPTGDPSIPFTVIQVSSNIGSLGFFGNVATDYGVFGLSQFGPFLATQAGADTIGDEIIPFFKTLDHTDLTFAVGIHDRLRQQIYWSISSQNASPFKNFGLTYSYAEKAWNIRVGGMWNVAGIIGDEDNFNLLYVGDNLGQIQEISQGNTDQDVIFNDGLGTVVTRNISLQGETPWMSFGNSESLKQLRNFRINCDTSDQILQIDVYTDQDDSAPKYTRYIDMSVPVLQRVANLAGYFRTVKFVLTTVGDPSPVKLNAIQIAYQQLGMRNQT